MLKWKIVKVSYQNEKVVIFTLKTMFRNKDYFLNCKCYNPQYFQLIKVSETEYMIDGIPFPNQYTNNKTGEIKHNVVMIITQLTEIAMKPNSYWNGNEPLPKAQISNKKPVDDLIDWGGDE